MNCSTKQGATHGCMCGCGYNSNPALWSRKKKLEMLNKTLDRLKDQQVEIEEAIAEIEKQ